uniref:GYF domain-containing protein n=1 Tax=Anaeromyxobacter terrae TaxID=2925406 RepID=UPI001F575A64
MKFTCDSCSAQYMISDEKVGPSGVKVRCKKCGTVIHVRRPAEEPAPAPAAPAPGAGLDVELGNAFDNAFGDAPARAPEPAPDLSATQAMGAEDAARIAAAPAPTTEWYVAIGQAQVGPLPLAEVKRKWEGGDVGPDSLVWRPGMGDWQPLSTVAELASQLAPVPQARAARPAEAGPSRGLEAAAAPAADVSWKPVAASALAALASEEVASHGAPVKKAEPRPLGGVKSLVDGLPEGGGVDPTGAIPLPIKGLERTEEKKIERRSSVARGAEEARSRRSVSRAVGVGVIAVAFVVAAGAAGVVWYMNKQLERVPAVAAAPAPAPAPAEAQPASVQQQAPAPAAPAPAGAVASAAPGATAAEPPAAAKPAAPPAAV